MLGKRWGQWSFPRGAMPRSGKTWTKPWRDWNRADELAQIVPAGPTRLAALEEELAAVGAEQRTFPADSDALREAVEHTRADAVRFETELSSAESALANLRERPVAIGSRLPQAISELDQITVAATPANGENLSPRQMAEQLRNRAELESLRAEIALLENERIAQSLRERIATLRIQLLKTQLAAEREWLAQIEQRLGEKVGDEMANLRRELADTFAALPTEYDELRTLAKKMEGWVGELEELADGGDCLARRSDQMRETLESLRRDNERLRRQIALGGFEGAFTQLLL